MVPPLPSFGGVEAYEVDIPAVEAPSGYVLAGTNTYLQRGHNVNTFFSDIHIH